MLKLSVVVSGWCIIEMICGVFRPKWLYFAKKSKRNSRSKSRVIKLEILTRQGKNNQLPSVSFIDTAAIAFCDKKTQHL